MLIPSVREPAVPVGVGDGEGDGTGVGEGVGAGEVCFPPPRSDLGAVFCLLAEATATRQAAVAAPTAKRDSGEYLENTAAPLHLRCSHHLPKTLSIS
jgi:hypothetical protein